MRFSLPIVMCGLLCFGCATTTNLPSDIDAAIRAAEKSAVENSNYESRSLRPFFFEHVMNECADLSFSDKTPFVLVLVLDGGGHSLKVYRNPETTVTRCLAERIGQSTFPVPPTAPYFALFDTRFER